MLTCFGKPESFLRLSCGKDYITLSDIDSALARARFNNDASTDQLTALEFMRARFKRIGNDGVDPCNPDRRGITLAWLEQYARRHGVTWDTLRFTQHQEMRPQRTQNQNCSIDNRRTTERSPQEIPRGDTPGPQRATPEQATDFREQLAEIEARHRKQCELASRLRRENHHKVKPNETLWSIAASVLDEDGIGSGDLATVQAKMREIRQLSNLPSWHVVKPGDQIYLRTEMQLERRIARLTNPRSTASYFRPSTVEFRPRSPMNFLYR